ncbi:Uncharacterized protein OBRU01_06992 [Operophtera brumata]|uniref:Collagenase NC10/endostatin domain-containing protein n=1 Tax=Operophtera brumata TaxID=104452 RepID=A0A0L7LK70_OPEBR|nr:Uncharacterized protein OBRU01_06992 [Operophtera brumata]
MNLYRNSKVLISDSYSCTKRPVYGVQNLISIVERKDRDLLVKNLYDKMLFPSWNSIFNGSGASLMQNANIYSFDGKNVMHSPHW